MTIAVPDLPMDDECRMLLQLRQTPELFAAIRNCSAPELARQKQLRGEFDEELVRAGLAVHDARLRAAGLLPDPDRLWLTRVGLEQSTAWLVALHKAERFRNGGPVHDLCCGIGMDTAALTRTVDCGSGHVTAVDVSPAMCLRAFWNAEQLGSTDCLSVLSADVTVRDWSGCLLHADPDRRAMTDRPTRRLEQYRPDLVWMQQLTRTARGGAVKVGPASNFLQKFPGCEIELISLNGECREATVWFGALAGPHAFRATALPSGETLSADPLSVWTDVAPAAGRFLLDPDPAVVRAGLLDVLAANHGIQRLDAEEEYLTSDQLPETAFVSAFEVDAVLPNRISDLKQLLRTNPASSYEIKCRRIPVDSSAVRRALPTGGGQPKVILFARIAGRASIVVARRCSSTDAGTEPE